jgi:uncharacterized protein (DUF2225 family)
MRRDELRFIFYILQSIIRKYLPRTNDENAEIFLAGDLEQNVATKREKEREREREREGEGEMRSREKSDVRGKK